MEESNIVSVSMKIMATSSKVWDIITSKKFAKELGSEFDKNAFVESDWKLGSKVYFKYEPDRLVSTGVVGKLIEHELIQVDYDFPGMEYVEKYSIEARDLMAILSVYAGPYGSDLAAQKVVWTNWLNRVKELGEM